MLTGSMPPDATGLPCAGLRVPSGRTRTTEIWLLPASAARRYRPSLVAWSDPWEPTIVPVDPAVRVAARGVVFHLDVTHHAARCGGDLRRPGEAGCDQCDHHADRP